MVVTAGGGCYALGPRFKNSQDFKHGLPRKTNSPASVCPRGSAQWVKLAWPVTTQTWALARSLPGSQLGCPKTSLAEASRLPGGGEEAALGRSPHPLLHGHSRSWRGLGFTSWLYPLAGCVALGERNHSSAPIYLEKRSRR